MTKKATLDEWRVLFDSTRGEGSALAFERMLASRQSSFADIAVAFGISKQRVSQIVHAHFPGYTRESAGLVSRRRGRLVRRPQP